MKGKLMILVCVLAALVLTGCPVKDPVTGKVDPYATAQQYIDYAKLMPAKAESLYGEVVFWLKLDAEKKAKADAIFNKTLANLKQALATAQKSLDAAIANKEKVGTDRVLAWLASSEGIWKELRALISGMIPAPTSGPQSVGGEVKGPPPSIDVLPVSLIKK